MRMAGASYPDIASVFGVSKQAVCQAVKPLIDKIGDTGQLRAYQSHKADVLEGAQLALVGDLIDKDKRKKATLGNVAYAVRNLNDMIRLERDQATSNVAVAHLDAIRSVEEADAEIESHRVDLMVEECQGMIRFLETTTGKHFSITELGKNRPIGRLDGIVDIVLKA